jgi:hypothetical protein
MMLERHSSFLWVGSFSVPTSSLEKTLGVSGNLMLMRVVQGVRDSKALRSR